MLSYEAIPPLVSAAAVLAAAAYASRERRRCAEARSAMLALRTEASEARRAYARTPFALHSLDGNGVVRDVSDAWLRLTGYPLSRAIGRPLSDFLAEPSAREGWETPPNDGGESFARIRTYDGRVLDVLVAGCAVTRPDGTPNGILGGFVDVSGRRVAEEALRQAQKLEAVGQLTGGAAHEFNNILAAISGSLEMVRHRLASGKVKDVDRLLEVAHASTLRAGTLTHRLLAFSRRQTLAPQHSDANALLVRMADIVRKAVGPSIEVAIDGNPGLWGVKVDPKQLEDAILNLCLNARDAMPDGGRLSLSTENLSLDAKSADERGLPPGSYVSISVSDGGVGMANDVAARAFEPFFTTKKGGQGTGLGLSVTYGFARQSGGQVRLQSKPGAGTTASILLPRHDAPAPEAAPDDPDPSSKAGIPRGRGSILVVDDEPLVRMLVVDMLDGMGYDAIEASDGPEAVKALESDAEIDLLVTDVGMPGMDGRQVAKAARKARPSLNVLFITGYAEAWSEGPPPGSEILTKPFEFAQLADHVERLAAVRA